LAREWEMAAGFWDGTPRDGNLPTSLLAVIGDGLVVLDAAGRVHYFNPSAQRLLGIPDGADLPFWRYVPELFPQLQCLETIRHQVFEAHISYPERRLLRVTCLPLPRPGEEKLWAVVLHDGSAEEVDRTAAIETGTGAAMQLLIGTMAHEIDNPLNTIHIQLQLLKRRLASVRGHGQELASMAEICEGEVERIHALLVDFLAALRPVKPVWQDVDWAALVRKTVAVRSGELARVHAVLDLPDEPVSVLGDGELLHRALSHVLRNALDATDDGGTIAIHLCCDATSALLRVEDDGKGIPMGAIPHLFQPQFSSKVMGNGLGLVAVQQIVRAHRGTVAIQARDPVGTAVTIGLPLKNPRFPVLEDFRPCALCDGGGPVERAVRHGDCGPAEGCVVQENVRPWPWKGNLPTTAAVREAMQAVDRRFFFGENPHLPADVDAPIPIGFGQTTSQPSLIAHMISMLDLDRLSTVLEIGTGSGYPTAILARLAGEVCTMEIIPELFAGAMARLHSLGMANVRGQNRSGQEPWGGGKMFSKIIVWAACEDVPAILVDQLDSGGIMVLPVGPQEGGQILTAVRRDGNGMLHRQASIAVRFVPFL
jgi:protein-L-isoaspartate(D-aspartate) O-methyltransferase